MDLGSIFTSSASGSCSRRAIDTAPRKVTSRFGEFLRRIGGGGIDRGAGFRHHDLGHLQVRQELDQSAASLSVSRDAVPLPIAISSTLCCLASRPSTASRFVPAPLRLVRIDRGVASTLPVAIHHRDLHAGAVAGIKAHGGARAGRCGEQKVAQIGGEHAHGLLLGRVPQPHPQIDAEVDLILVRQAQRAVS